MPMTRVPYPVSAAAIASAEALSVANINDPSAELGAIAGTVVGEQRLCYQAVAGANEWTLYSWDSASATGALTPYRINGTSGQWQAVAGKYQNGSAYQNEGTAIFDGATVIVGTLGATAQQAAMISTLNTPRLQMSGTSLDDSSMLLTRFANTAGSASYVVFARSGSAVLGTQAAVATNDILGRVLANGSDGTRMRSAAYIDFLVGTGTVSSSSMPGSVQVYTTADGAVTGTLRSTWNAAGQNVIGSTQTAYAYDNNATAGTASLEVNGTGAGTAGAMVSRWSNNTDPPTFVGAKSKGGAVGTHTAVVAGDSLARFLGNGSDGTQFRTAGWVEVSVGTGTISSSSMPGRVQVYTCNDGAVTGTLRTTWDQNGRLVHSTTSTAQSVEVLSTTLAPGIQTNGTGTTGSGMMASKWIADATGPTLTLAKSRSGTIGTMTIVQTGDALGRLSGNGSDGTQMREGARISFLVGTGTPSTSSMPGLINIATTADGSVTPTNRQTIDAAGQIAFLATTDSTSATTGVTINSGGAYTAKNLLSGQGIGYGVTSTATAAATTTLTSSSRVIQKFTGTTTQTINFPAANLFGAGIAVRYTIDNHSTGIVTPTRAGSDTFKGGGTTYPVAGGASTTFVSDGVSVWGVA